MSTSEQSEQERLLTRYGRKFSAGQVIFDAGDAAEEAFLLQEGRVRLIKRVGATERSLRVVRPGDLFGESALVPGATRSSTAVALAECSALALAQTTFQHVFSSNPAVGLRVLQQLIRRLRDAEDQIEVLLLRDTQVKVVVALLQLSQEALRAQHAPTNSVAISVSPMELSARVGLDVETVKRNVQQLRNSNYVQIVDERIDIVDVDALRELRGLLDVKDQIVGANVGPTSGGTP
jgi:CRP-like cAMP-binding protein